MGRRKEKGCQKVFPASKCNAPLPPQFAKNVLACRFAKRLFLASKILLNKLLQHCIEISLNRIPQSMMTTVPKREGKFHCGDNCGRRRSL